MSRKTAAFRKWIVTRLADIATDLLERSSSIHRADCLSFGGFCHHNEHVRLCMKDRWHTDSHAYDEFDPSLYLTGRLTIPEK